ncbi:hypothetical protein LOK49_LG05G01137 [Camellia lanceoleosa]|uniref:Uncharacterized protein n=1 Tax=Camellia lanceoleosa TaxID=1840588 RepID=A0ACC0HQH9_9ERIC|nr:hypothetical protein LOK49_LG05G01137 [Camellia lanceoleosa]
MTQRGAHHGTARLQEMEKGVIGTDIEVAENIETGTRGRGMGRTEAVTETETKRGTKIETGTGIATGIRDSVVVTMRKRQIESENGHAEVKAIRKGIGMSMIER